MSAETEEVIHRKPRTGRKALFAVVGALSVVAVVVAAGALSGWLGGRPPVTLVGAGATFPYPLINKWSIEYHALKGVQVNYQSIGSGGGIQQVTARTVDFGASDAPLSAAERAAAPGLLHIPETLGAVAFVYNLPNVKSGLNLTGPIIADIYLCRITKWNDANLTALNPSTPLPDRDIFVVHRSDGSGTTFVWTDYLSKASPAWASQVEKGKSVNWPCGLGAKGNEGVAGVVAGNRYAVGYVELAYAEIQRMTYAAVKNAAGNFILPSMNSTAAAAASATLPNGEESWTNVSIVDPTGAASYPIASFTYLLVYRELNGFGPAMSPAKAKALVDFVWWAVHEGQTFAPALLYPALPPSVVTADERTIGLITFNGRALR